MNMKMKQTMLLLFILILLSLRCNTTEPPQSKATLTLELEDVSCTEAWIMLKLKDIPLPADVTLYKNNNAQNNILCYGDTLLYVDSLLPKQTYTFQSVIQPFNQSTVSSNELSVTTIDTTNHNFTWQIYTFDGLTGSSVLNDIAIINANDIWAVGEIYMKDSLGNPDPHAYNAVHWDGGEWRLYRIMFYTICGQTSLSSYPAKAIFGFSENDVWIAGGGRQLARINGTNQVDKICLPFSMVINKLWGSSSNDLYAVGNRGNIAHWDGVKWRKIETSTEYDLTNIHGIKNNLTGITEVYCTAVDFFSNDAKVLTVSNDNETKIIDLNIGYIYSFWTRNGIDFYLCGEKLYRNNLGRKSKVKVNNSSSIIGISGYDYNDIYLIGANQFFSHFNGTTWFNYPKSIFSTLSEYTVIAATSQVVVAGGTSISKIQIMIGSK